MDFAGMGITISSRLLFLSLEEIVIFTWLKIHR